LLGNPNAASNSQPSTSTDEPTKPVETTTTTTNVITTATPPDPTKPWLNVRLPGNLVPSHYVVDLQPILTANATGFYSFNGNSSVTFMVEKSTPFIIIHSNKLNYKTIEVLDQTVSLM